MISNIIKIFAWLIFAAVLLVVVAFVGVFHFGFLEFGINQQLQKLVGDQAPVEVTIGEIQGDFFTALDIQDVIVEYNDGNIRYRIAEIPHIHAIYSLADIWRGKLHIQTLVIDSARFTVQQDTSGTWLIPRPVRQEQARPSILPSFSVELLAVNHSSISLRGVRQTWRADSLNLLAGAQVFEGAYSLDLRGLTMKTNFHNSRIGSAKGKFTLNGPQLVFKDVEFEADRAKLAVDGFLRFDSLITGRAVIKEITADMGYVGEIVGKNYTGELTISGAVDVNGPSLSGPLEIKGSFQQRSFEEITADLTFANGVIVADTIYGQVLNGCQVTGAMSLDFNSERPRYQFDGRIQNLNLTYLASGAVTSDLSGRVSLKGTGLSSQYMRIEIKTDLEESYLDIFHAHRLSGDMIVYTDSLRLLPGYQIDYFENNFSAAGSIDYKGRLDIRGRASLENLDRFDSLTFITDIGGRASATYALYGDLLDPGVSGSLYSDSLWLYEYFIADAVFDIDVDRFMTRRTGTVRFQNDSVSVWGFPLDSVRASLIIDSNIVYFDSLGTFIGEAALVTDGRYDYSLTPQPISLYDLSLSFRENSYHESDTIRMLYDTAGINFKSLPLEGDGESAFLTGRVGFDQSIDVSVDLSQVNIAPWTEFSELLPTFVGALSCRAEISGDSADLQFTLEGKIDSLAYKDLLIGNISGRSHYESNLLTIDTFSLESPGGSHSARGTVPLDMRLTGLADSAFPGEQQLQIESLESDFTFVSFFLPQVETLEGTLSATATVSGTPLKPQLNGAANFRGDLLKIYELETPAESLSLDFAMHNQFVTITQGFCRFPPETREPDENKKFREDRFGTVTIAPDSRIEILGVDSIYYDSIRMSATNIPIKYTLGAFAGKVDAELVINGITPPTVTGEVNVIKALYEEEFLPEDAGYVLLSQFERPDSWNMDIDMTIVSNCVVRNSDMDAEFKGTGNGRRELGLWSFVYNLEVIRGRVFLPASTFRLDPAGTVINDDFTVNNPNLNLVARTKVRVPQLDLAGSGAPKSKQVDAVILVTGTLDNPIISYYDDPSINDADKISQDQLYSLLALGFQLDTRESGWEAATISVVEGAASILSANITRATARTIGVETFDIDPDLDVQQTEITLGGYWIPQLYTYGKTDVGVQGTEFGFEAYIGRHLLLQGKRDENDHYYLFLNFGWDY